MDARASKMFEAALRDLLARTGAGAAGRTGGARLRLDQVVVAYQAAFPCDSMLPDMRTRLREAIAALSARGVVSLPGDESGGDDGGAGAGGARQDVGLPMIVEMSASAHFMPAPSKRLN